MTDQANANAVPNTAAEMTAKAWLQKEITNISDEDRKLLEEYSGLSPTEVVPHVTAFRDKAFKIFPYPCIGLMRFLAFNSNRLTFYPTIVSKLRDGATFLDAGCCFAQEIRHLVFAHGLDSSKFSGFDLEPGFVDLGYDLFQDRGRLRATLTSGDLLEQQDQNDAPGSNLAAFDNTMDIVCASNVLHVFERDAMAQAAARLVRFARPVPGAILYGKQVGNLNAGSYDTGVFAGKSTYLHSEESLRAFWHEVCKSTNTRWKIECGYFEVEEEARKAATRKWQQPGHRMLWWMLTRE